MTLRENIDRLIFSTCFLINNKTLSEFWGGEISVKTLIKKWLLWKDGDLKLILDFLSFQFYLFLDFLEKE